MIGQKSLINDSMPFREERKKTGSRAESSTVDPLRQRPPWKVNFRRNIKEVYIRRK